MTLPNSHFTHRQAGIVRIEIAALAVLLVALVTVLATTHSLPGSSPAWSQEMAQTDAPAPRPERIHAEALIDATLRSHVQTASVTESDRP